MIISLHGKVYTQTNPCTNLVGVVRGNRMTAMLLYSITHIIALSATYPYHHSTLSQHTANTFCRLLLLSNWCCHLGTLYKLC